MMTTDLGACEWFVWDLRRSNLIDRGQLDQLVGEFLSRNQGAEPAALAEHLVQSKLLTAFQAERLLQGKTQGFVLGPFVLKDALGVGSMGTVYRAESKTDGKEYAVKVLPRRSMWNVRIARRKVRAFEKCQHPAVVPFVDVGTSGGMHYLAWPLIEGTTLEKIVMQQGPFTVPQAIDLALQTTRGLQIVHHQGLFHGLLKPSNLMLSPDGQVKILDFGIGCLLSETEGESLVDTMSTANSVNSGLDCASPESIMDPTNLTAIGDQYSLGCVLYFFLSGQYPFPDGTAVEKMMAHQTKQPAPLCTLNPNIPSDLLAVIEQLMEKNPENRFPTTEAVIDALQPFASGNGAAISFNNPQQLEVPKNVAARTPLPSSDRKVTPKPIPAAPVAPSAVVPPPPVPESNHGAYAPVPPQAQPPMAQVPQQYHQQQYPPQVPQQYQQQYQQQQYQQQPYPPQAVPMYGQPQGQEKLSWDQRLGPVGIALIAVVAGTAAWLLSSLLN